MFKLHSPSASGYISPEHAHYIYYDMWPFPLENVTQTTGGDRENSIAHCAPVRNCEKWELSASIIFLSLALGFIASQNAHLIKRRENTLTVMHASVCFNCTAQVHKYTRQRACTLTFLHPFPHFLRGEVRLSFVWGSRPGFSLGWHPPHVNSHSLQKPLMQAPAQTVFWQWATICLT